MNLWCYHFQYLYNCALEKQISRKLLQRRMYAITDPNMFPVKPLSWFNFFSNTSIKNSLIFLQLKQNLVAFKTPSLPSLPLMANILSTSIIFFALSMTSSHITWKNWAWVLQMKNEMITKFKVLKLIYLYSREYDRMKKRWFLPIVRKVNIFQDYMHICNCCLQKMFQGLRIFIHPNVFNRFFQSSEKWKFFSECTRQSVYIFFQTNKIMHSCVIWNFSSQFINCWLQSFQKYHPCSNFFRKVQNEYPDME